MDPGFPVVGGHLPHRGGADFRRGSFSVKMYAKMKEFGSHLGVGVGGRAGGAHSGSDNVNCDLVSDNDSNDLG